MNPAKFIENKSSLAILRDCLKLANKMVDDPLKARAVRTLILAEFRKHREEFVNERIYELKMNAVKGISNYIIYTVQKEYDLKPNKHIFQEEEEEEEDTFPQEKSKE